MLSVKYCSFVRQLDGNQDNEERVKEEFIYRQVSWQGPMTPIFSFQKDKTCGFIDREKVAMAKLQAPARAGDPI